MQSQAAVSIIAPSGELFRGGERAWGAEMGEGREDQGVDLAVVSMTRSYPL